MSAINLAQNNIQASEYSDNIGDGMPQTHSLQCRQIDEARTANVVPVRGSNDTIGNQIKTQLSLGRLGPRKGLARGNLDLVRLLTR